MILRLRNILSAVLLLMTLAVVGSAQTTTLSSGGRYTRYITTAGSYTITAVGANGGMNYPNGTTVVGGTGATVSGTFTLNACDELTIVVGSAGNRSFGNAGSGGGGGGGTAVILNGTRLLLVAGGGGGATTTTGGGGGGGRVSASPTPAGGATASGSYNGAGGGGYGYAGASATGACSPSTAGGGGAATLFAVSTGGTGVTAGCVAGGDGAGGAGFGGGGGANGFGGGGGGGYVGGNGFISGTAMAEGGDSYIDPLASSTSATAGTTGGGNSSYVDGSVSINTTLAASRSLSTATTTTSSTQTQAPSASTTYQNQCTLIASVTPAGASPVTGDVSSTVYIDPSVQAYNGSPYVQRHFDILPTTSPNTATANITLYFTQADFTAYNAARGSNPALPTASNDPGGNKSNLRINQFHGTPSGGTAPSNYPYTWPGSGPARVVITPTTITWNATTSLWEVTFPVTGFSGFFAATNVATPLPVQLLSLTATKTAGVNRLEWKTAAKDAGTSYEITRSQDGSSFEPIATVAGTNQSTYRYDDGMQSSGTVYYRLKVSEAGASSWSNVVSLGAEAAVSVRIAPQPAHSTILITPSAPALIGGVATIRDMQGRVVATVTLSAAQRVDISQWAAGTYSLSLPNGEVIKVVKL